MAITTPSSTKVTRMSVIRRAVLILVLFLVSGSIAYPAPANKLIRGVNSALGAGIPELSKKFVLGLDLQGGTRLEYKADVSNIDLKDQPAAVEGVRDVIERRVNAMGVSEPVVTTAKAGDEQRVTVELAGVRDIKEAIKTIGETPILEFKEQNNEPPRQLTADEKKQMDAKNAAVDAKAKDILARVQKDPNSFEQVAKTTSEDLSTRDAGGKLGFIKDKPEAREIFDAVKNDAAGTVHGNVIQVAGADVIAKVDESKDAGTEIHASHILIPFAGSANSDSTLTKEQAMAKITDIKKQVTPQNFTELAKKNSQEPGADKSGGDLGWFGKGVMVPAFEEAVFKLQKGEISGIIESPFGYHIVWVQDQRPLHDVNVRVIVLKRTQESDILPAQDGWKTTQLTGKYLKKSQLEFDQRIGTPQVGLVFDAEGTKLFADITKRNIGKPVAIFLDGQPISTPVVQSEITGGQAVINGSFSIQEAKLLAQRLNAGALPVPITLIAQESVGPTLGAASVDASLIAGLCGFLLVALFIVLLYRIPGVIAIGALTLYVALSLAVFKLVPVTLTLSGIAGFILSIGIAVDANVLVFERLKEELKSGKTLKSALEEAFRRAWPSIRDGNMTTLISCAVLYWFSSSVIKGFALTLAIGISLSMFSAIIVTRTLLRYVAGLAFAEKMPRAFLGQESQQS